MYGDIIFRVGLVGQDDILDGVHIIESFGWGGKEGSLTGKFHHGILMTLGTVEDLLPVEVVTSEVGVLDEGLLVEGLSEVHGFRGLD